MTGRGRRVNAQIDAPPIGASVAIGSLSINILALALPLILLQVFDRIVPNAASGTLTVLFSALVIALAMDFVLKVARILLLGHSSAKFEIELRDQALARIIEADSHAFAQDNAGTHIDRLGGITQLRDHFGGQGRLLRIDLPFTAIFIGMIGYIGGWLVAVPLGCLFAIAVISAAIRLLQAPVIAERQSVDRRRDSFLLEVLEQIVTVKALGAEDQFLRRFELLQAQSGRATEQLVWIAGVSQSFGAVFGQVAVVAMVGVGAWLTIAGQIGMAELAACMLLNGRAVQPLLKLLGLWAQLEGLRAAEQRVEDILNLEAPKGFSRYDGEIDPTIRFTNVTLKPKGRDKTIFEDLSFEIAAGQSALIRGTDGSGKSTILRMILGEQPPTSGRVRVGRDDPRALIHRRDIGEISYIDQSPVIFNGTIRENLSMFGDRPREDAALFAAEKISLDRDVLRLPLGYDTVIGGASGAVLPSGILQKICIARVLGRRPLILLFNNAASAIDGAAREDIRTALKALRGRTTLLIVSQHILTEADTDVIIDVTPEERRAAPAPSTPAPQSASLQDWLRDGETERKPLRIGRLPGPAEAPAATVARG